MTSRPKPRSQFRHFQRKDAHPDTIDMQPRYLTDHSLTEKGDTNTKDKNLPQYNSNGHQINHAGFRVTRFVAPDGESGRKWCHPWHFLRICWRSSSHASQYTNILWPFTLAAMVLHFGYPEHELWIFITAYIGMVPAANLVGFAGQELARKLPKVAGVILETTFGSIVEIILFMVLISGGNQNVSVIRAAILGSILANLLFCLGRFYVA